MVGVRAYGWNDKNRYALALLATILGGNMSSRLFMEVREKRGLAYYVKTGVEAFEDCGYLATNAGVKHQNLKLTIQTILKEYVKIAQRKVSEKELKKAKSFLKGKAVMSMEASDEVAMFFIEQKVTKKKVMTLEEKMHLIDQVTADEILKVAQEIFQASKLNVAVIGPHKDVQKIKKLLIF
jgi:predicted Zn-dependent peptidase